MILLHQVDNLNLVEKEGDLEEIKSRITKNNKSKINL